MSTSSRDPREAQHRPPFEPQQQSSSGRAANMDPRPAQPAELAPSLVFLASDEARYVSGGVTGGPLLA